MTQTDSEKADAARKSLEYVKDGMVVGLGTGTLAGNPGVGPPARLARLGFAPGLPL